MGRLEDIQMVVKKESGKMNHLSHITSTYNSYLDSSLWLCRHYEEKSPYRSSKNRDEVIPMKLLALGI
jgi:hypothetical protein